VALTAEETIATKQKYTTSQKGPTTNKQDRALLQPLKSILLQTFSKFFVDKYGQHVSVVPSDFFGEIEVKAIINYFGNFHNEANLRGVIKGEKVGGQLVVLMKAIEAFQSQTTTGKEEQLQEQLQMEDLCIVGG
jgi:hypothetical protein